jgi:hypothetical protein
MRSFCISFLQIQCVYSGALYGPITGEPGGGGRCYVYRGETAVDAVAMCCQDHTMCVWPASDMGTLLTLHVLS